MRSYYRWGPLVAWAIVTGSALGLMIAHSYALAAYLTVIGLFLLWTPVLVRRAFRQGWLAGRKAMLLSIPEAQRRGMNFSEWVTAEAERDGAQVVVVEKDPE